MAKMTPEQEALYAPNWALRAAPVMAAQFEYDRLRPAWEREARRPAGGKRVARLT